ncbi:MAG: putative chaperone CsaA [Eubacteriales bacterium SKADARSKE-1]|nr:putative chaperone CsaA [Eubacteriales bacterium SKADARSKE-1]
MATFEDFLKLDIRVGEILSAEVLKQAKKPAYKLLVDFGEEIGIKKSSAQITQCYTLEELIGKQVLGIVNFSPRQITNFISEVLILGIYSDPGVVLIQPGKKVKNGDKLG